MLKRLILILACLTLIIIPASGDTASPAPIQSITERRLEELSKSVVLITMVPSGAMGTGVVYEASKDESKILTAGHVCLAGEATGAFVTTKDNYIYSGISMAAREDVDLCVITVAVQLPVIKIAKTYLLRKGDEVYTISAPMGVYSFPYVGHVGGWQSIRGFNHYLVGINAAPGSSGSPLMYRGRLIGLITMIIDQSPFPSFSSASIAVPVEVINGFLFWVEHYEKDIMDDVISTNP